MTLMASASLMLMHWVLAFPPDPEMPVFSLLVPALPGVVLAGLICLFCGSGFPSRPRK